MTDFDIPEFPKRLAEKLRTIREHYGLTPDEIAPLLGVKEGAVIAAYEHDLGSRVPGGLLVTTLWRYVNLAVCEIEDLIDDDREVTFTPGKIIRV